MKIPSTFSVLWILVVHSCSGLSLFPRALIRQKLPKAHTVRQCSKDAFNAVMVVPTGIGASVGGYAGDALPAARLLASVVDNLITHPNVMNGAMLYMPRDNIQYVEGSSLDAFAEGKLNLQPLHKGSHRIGLLLDRAMEEELRLRHIQVADAMRATLGIDVAHCAVTSRNVGVQLRQSPSGAAWGSVGDTDTLVEGARALVEQHGCTAVAVVVRFPEDDDIEGSLGGVTAAEAFERYRAGSGVDAIAGAEALISHVIGQALRVPCAHAPAFSPMSADPSVSPKACAEELGYTFLPCVLANLHRAPRLVPREASGHPRPGSLITANDVDVVVAPWNALGGAAVLAFLAMGKTVIAVQDNTTTMRVTGTDLLHGSSNTDRWGRSEHCDRCGDGRRGDSAAATLPGRGKMGIVVHARSYAEAAGMIAALKEGILLDAITPYVTPISVTAL